MSHLTRMEVSTLGGLNATVNRFEPDLSSAWIRLESRAITNHRRNSLWSLTYLATPFSQEPHSRGLSSMMLSPGGAATALSRPLPLGDPKDLPIMPRERARAPECTARACARARVAPLPCDRGKIPNTSKQKSSVRLCQVFKPQKPGGGFFSAAAQSAEAALGEDHPGRPSLPARAGKTRENVRRVSTWASRAPAARWV